MKTALKFLLAATVMSVPAKLFACAACGSANGQVDASPLTDGMNLGILTLFAVIVTVLAAITTFFVFIIRKGAALAAAAENSAQPTRL